MYSPFYRFVWAPRQIKNAVREKRPYTDDGEVKKFSSNILANISAKEGAAGSRCAPGCKDCVSGSRRKSRSSSPSHHRSKRDSSRSRSRGSHGTSRRHRSKDSSRSRSQDSHGTPRRHRSKRDSSRSRSRHSHATSSRNRDADSRASRRKGASGGSKKK